MSNTKNGFLGAGIALLVLFTIFSCFFLPTDDFTKDGWYIKLNIDPASGSKAINVTEYTVTELLIKVYDPDEQLIQTVHWYAGDGSQSYLIPVGEQGQYEIQITHIGEKNGDDYEVSESAVFNMQAMTITVIDIVPGFIGEINIEPGDEEPPVDPIIGVWEGTWIDIGGDSFTINVEYKADGTFTEIFADIPPTFSATFSGTYVHDSAAKTITITVTSTTDPGVVPVGYTETTLYSLSADNNIITVTSSNGSGTITRQ
jgi:hypothetical protein